jgi:hypothetical protein
MRTDELIGWMVSGLEPVDLRAVWRRGLLVLCGALILSAALTAMLLGVNPDLSGMARQPMFWVREGFCLSMGAGALVCAARGLRPGRRLGRAPLGIGLTLFALWLLGLQAWWAASAGARLPLLLGQTAWVCPWLIALVSAPLFVAAFWISRSMAPTQLRRAGAFAGLAAGALGALVYTLHCPELAAPFLGLWYVLGMLLPALAGAALGPWLLRW